MTLGKILKNIVERKVSNYNLSYDPPHHFLLNTIKDIPDLSELKISPILLVTDKNSDSLISIAFTIKIISSLGSNRKLFVLTEGKHSELIQNECKEYDINLEGLIEKEIIKMDDISQIVSKNNIGLLIVSFGHQLWNKIILNIPVSVLVTSVKNIH